MAPVYKLHYFDCLGEAEPIRYLLSYGGVHFEDVIVRRSVEWPLVKKTAPFGTLPVLHVDDKTLFQSVAICRWLAEKFQLLPEDEFLAAELDAIVQTIHDLGVRVHEWYTETVGSTKSQRFAELDTELIPLYFKNFEEWILKRGGYFGGKQLSWADLYFVGIMESVESMWGSRLLQNKYPGLYQLCTRVHAVPAINTYIAKRPVYKH